MKLHATRSFFAATAATTVLLMTAACGADETDSTTSSESSGESSTESESDAGSESTGEYTDGDYEANGTYQNPGGQSSVNVELTLEGGVVTALTVTPEASGTSRQYQEKFVSGINDEVVGKSIDELDVSKVSGSSLTSGGFNTAIEEIKAEAQV